MQVVTRRLSEKLVIEPNLVIAILGVHWNIVRLGIHSENPVVIRDFNPKDYVFSCNEKGRG
ncbi:carbon storage regulator [Legionella geestiana]|uniref:carbon storage regulator n=1 Tax=Legionella geestiana TaxID=45065 RepID=UPI000B15DE78|nr:carbon storage regulator [Legionella geestiana]QBS13508.1 hypothetical protein E4T54_11775 [Legionella geestiana]STX59212.1 carbon storage regulator [Legionella geestiana]